MTKLKAFADDKIHVNVAQMMISVFDRVEKIVGKCWLPAFSPSLTVFSKDFSYRVVKSRDYVVKC